MSRTGTLLLALVIMLGLAAPGTVAAEATTPPMKREILALVNGGAEKNLANSEIHRLAEFPLNHLGFVLVYRDVRDPLPPVEEAATRYAAVMTWFGSSLEEPRPYLRWASAMADRGAKLLIMGEIGADGTGRDLALVNDLLARLGLVHAGEYIAMTSEARVLRQDPAVYGFEAKLDADLPAFPTIMSRDPDVEPALVLALGTGRNSREIVLAATGPGGGYAAGNYEIRYEPYADRVAWLLNPIAFFERALKPPRRPIPDVTTVTGRRLYFSHIDGDGWNNAADIPRYRRTQTLAGEVMLTELIAPYPDLPVTVGLIAGDVLASEGGHPETEPTARRLLALPQVELGSHTCTHPFDWSFYETYDRSKELARLATGSGTPVNPTYFDRLRALASFGKARGPAPGTPDLPRAYSRNPFDLGIEVEKAVSLTEALAPQGKRLKLYQWSGDARPFEAAIHRTRKAGLRNINGGDSRLDSEFPSLAYVAPVARPVGSERQIYAVNSNENTYTNDWKGPFFAFRNLEETLRNTETPVRYKGFNLYYHVYSAEKQASLDAVRYLLDYARSQPLTPITASHYAAIADGFFTTEITPLGTDRWKIANRDGLATVRFDGANDVALDLAASTGVLGETRHGGALYVALDPAEPDAIVALHPRDETATPPRPLLVASRWPMSHLAVGSMCDVAFAASGFGNGEMTWRATPNAAYRFVVARNGTPLHAATATAGTDGLVHTSLPVDAIEPVSIHMTCDTPAGEAHQ